MAKFIWNMTKKQLWHKYNCFSVTDARKINSILIRLIIPSAMLCYVIMYVILPAKATDEQWYTLFVTKAAQSVIFSVISYSYFKDSRDAGMATAVMVYAGINFFAEVLGFSQKMFWFDAMAKLFFVGMAYYILRDIWNRCKKDEGDDDKVL